MVGHGYEGPYRYQLNDSTYLDSNGVNAILEIDPNLIAEVIPILDFCHSGGFIENIKGENKEGENRICITSCAEDESANFSEDNLSFSTLFFNEIRKGKKISDAFQFILNPMSTCQTPLLEANGDDEPNTPDDYTRADFHLGLDTIAGGDWEGIQEIRNNQYYINDPNDISLQVVVNKISEDIEVFAEIKPPYSLQVFSGKKPVCRLKSLGNGVYEFKKDDMRIFQFGGGYNITLYAQDNSNNLPEVSKSEKAFIIHKGKDFFEPDDTLEQAKQIYPIGCIQTHTFHTAADNDWVYFYAHSNRFYTIEAQDIVNSNRPIKLCLYDSDEGLFPDGNNYNSINNWSPANDNYYYLQVSYEGEFPANGLAYRLKIKRSSWAGASDIIGRIINKHGEGINGVIVELLSTAAPKSTYTYSAPTNPTNKGWYLFPRVASGNYTLKITCPNSSSFLLWPINVPDSLTPQWIGEIAFDCHSDGNITDPIFVSKITDSYYKWLKKHFDPNQEEDPAEDYEGDGLTNWEEFLFDRNPKIRDFKCLLYEGMNLFPYYGYTKPANKFFKNKLDKGDFLWIYSSPDHQWNIIYKDQNNLISMPNDLSQMKVEEGKGYFIYRESPKIDPQVIFQAENRCATGLSTGFNLRGGLNVIGISSIDEGSSAFEFLKKSEKVQSINRLNPKRRAWESSYRFFGQSAGAGFPIKPSEAYLILSE